MQQLQPDFFVFLKFKSEIPVATARERGYAGGIYIKKDISRKPAVATVAGGMMTHQQIHQTLTRLRRAVVAPVVAGHDNTGEPLYLFTSLLTVIRRDTACTSVPGMCGKLCGIVCRHLEYLVGCHHCYFNISVSFSRPFSIIYVCKCPFCSP